MSVKVSSPVQYVKICSLYGAGFYYIPGTDMCLKVGGWVRFEDGYRGGNSLTTQSFGGGFQNTLAATNDNTMRTRGYITADARNQSEYGTIRSYIAVGLNYDSPAAGSGSTFSSNRAFIQFAGFTFGTTQSFYDFFSTPATSYYAAYPASDTGDPGWKVAAYTAQFGNGLSATVGFEEPRSTNVYDANNVIANGSVAGSAPAAAGNITVAGSTFGGLLNPTAVGGLLTSQNNSAAGETLPDIVANLRVDQAWGSAQIMGAVHHLNNAYYGSTESTGNPSAAYGYALGAGLKLNAPMIGSGDYLQLQGNYTVGAFRYASFTANGSYAPAYVNGSNLSYGMVADGVYGGTIAAGTATSIQLTTAWSVNAAYEHFWNKQWRTSLYGGYLGVSYNATANTMVCAAEAIGANGSNGATNVGFFGAGLNGACNNNWSQWWVGSRTQWNVTPDTYLGLDVFYQVLGTATPGSSTVLAGNLGGGTVGTGAAPQPYNIKDQGSLAFRFRAHKDFYP
jgi:hypothetical protein